VVLLVERYRAYHPAYSLHFGDPQGGYALLIGQDQQLDNQFLCNQSQVSLAIPDHLLTKSTHSQHILLDRWEIMAGLLDFESRSRYPEAIDPFTFGIKELRTSTHVLNSV